MSLQMKYLLVLFLALAIPLFSIAQTKKLGGIYEYGHDDKSDTTAYGIIYIYPNSDATMLFSLELNRGAPSYNQGYMVGEMIMTGKNKAEFKIKNEEIFIDCEVTFEFDKDKLYMRSEDSDIDCGFGHAVYPYADFIRTDKNIPETFEDFGEEEVSFEDFDWKSWWYH